MSAEDPAKLAQNPIGNLISPAGDPDLVVYCAFPVSPCLAIPPSIGRYLAYWGILAVGESPPPTASRGLNVSTGRKTALASILSAPAPKGGS